MQEIMNDVRSARRKSNRSTYVSSQQSIFGSAMESLFGKNSIFSALEDPRGEEHSLQDATAAASGNLDEDDSLQNLPGRRQSES
mmetsp:Transcript_12764/g.15172  ORF Transcript_12764/g.15172 Transcript_12764/m.15172 type:complete len:84 (-) Transcript_12764:639-890(-)